jgi:hypothetical protein
VGTDRLKSQTQIDSLLKEIGASDPRAAVRSKARSLVALYCFHFGNPTFPMKLRLVSVSVSGTRLAILFSPGTN